MDLGHGPGNAEVSPEPTHRWLSHTRIFHGPTPSPIAKANSEWQSPGQQPAFYLDEEMPQGLGSGTPLHDAGVGSVVLLVYALPRVWLRIVACQRKTWKMDRTV